MTHPSTESRRQWAPSCRLDALKVRAQTYARIRTFFHERDVLEVETPLLGSSTATDPFLASVPACLRLASDQQGREFYLHTSPEFPMKRLLAAGSGAIYQICKTFRDGETGKRHNPEFTMLEWYRPDFSLKQLMAEVAELVTLVLGQQNLGVEHVSYREIFERCLGVDPFCVSDAQLRQLAEEKSGIVSSDTNTPPLSRDDYLNLLLTSSIEPELGRDNKGGPALCFVYGYPASQASLAKLVEDEQGQWVAERFELYIQGLEIANGYFELTDAQEQLSRFEQDNEQRGMLGLPQIPLDQHLLNALTAGLPACSGVALGLDRLLMVKLQAQAIDEVISFPIDRV